MINECLGVRMAKPGKPYMRDAQHIVPRVLQWSFFILYTDRTWMPIFKASGFRSALKFSRTSSSTSGRGLNK